MNETIAAIATAPGEAGIGIIRISGPESESILKKIFRYRSGRTADEFAPRRMIFGNIADYRNSDFSASDGAGSAPEIIDEAMVVFMPAPFTYTGEDVAEIQCHGSAVSMRRILSLVIESGASVPERGEFTKRAFLNGKMDLSQAEAVIDVIKAKSEAGSSAAVAQLSGRLSARIGEIRKAMADLISDIAVQIEYPEEDLEELITDEIISRIADVYQDVKKLADTAQTGKVLKDGMRISIVGRPNVGKSSLMNALLREDRAIVTDIPGTTRDTIEEYADLDGIPVRITDTAGIRDSEDKIERIGIEKSREAIENADLVILMTDSSEKLSDEDREVFALLSGKKCIAVMNKSDKPSAVDKTELLAEAGLDEDTAVICMSAHLGEGIESLISEIKNMVINGDINPEQDLMIANARHEHLLNEAMKSLSDAKTMLMQGEALDFAESDLRTAWMQLGEITGEAVADDIVNEIFSRFCLGK